MAKGYDPVTATKGAYSQMKNVVRREAYLMAFNRAFFRYDWTAHWSGFVKDYNQR